MKTQTVLTALVLSLAACTSSKMQTQLTTPSQEPRQASTTITGANAERAVGWPDLGRGEARFIRIDLGPDSLAECRRISPKFPFDSASTYAVDRAELAAFASCLNSPTMRDRPVLLVGRADPRGTDTYNDKLGVRRATAIKELLIEQGIDGGRIRIVSEGERGALGIQENGYESEQQSPSYSYGFDRRVDVIVAGTHAP